MSPSPAIPMIHGALDPFMPVSAVGITNDRFVFRLHGGQTCALTFIDLCDPVRLTALCGGETWLRHYFPTERRRYDAHSDAGRWVSTGINVGVAAHFLADLCIQRQTEALLSGSHVSPRQRWWDRLRDWIDRHFYLAIAAVKASATPRRARAS